MGRRRDRGGGSREKEDTNRDVFNTQIQITPFPDNLGASVQFSNSCSRPVDPFSTPVLLLPQPRLDHFIAYALHGTRLHSSLTFAALYLLQRLKARFASVDIKYFAVVQSSPHPFCTTSSSSRLDLSSVRLGWICCCTPLPPLCACGQQVLRRRPPTFGHLIYHLLHSVRVLLLIYTASG